MPKLLKPGKFHLATAGFASAIELGCSHFLSEDLQDGHVIGGLTVINPFLHAPDTLFGPVQD